MRLTRSLQYSLILGWVAGSVGGCRSQETPGKLDPYDIGGYMRRLGQSDSAEAKEIRARLKSVAGDLINERELARKEKIPVFPADLSRPPIPDSENAAPLYV